jgi:2-oxoglutarate ferredoxin oxidoreductase subunit gamma
MPKITQILLSGLGGQGIMLVGTLLGQAGVIERRYASASNAYGAQARGAWCKSEVILSDVPIDFPHLTTPDFLFIMSQNSYNMYFEDIRENGIIFYDKGLVIPKENMEVKQIGIPATEYAVKKLNNPQAANLILLGLFIKTTNVVTPKAIRKAIALNVSGRFRTVNLHALEIGMSEGRKIHG